MRPIDEPRISLLNGLFVCHCIGCGRENSYSTKATALKSLERGNCSSCKKDYRDFRDKGTDSALSIYKNKAGLWCSKCGGCGVEQAYTRKEHARSSSRGGWRCKSCASYENRTAPSFYREFRLVDIESFEKNAIGRDLSWELDVDAVPSLWASQKGKCALSGLPMIKHPRTWSIDRIDSNQGYTQRNVQLVDKRVNMMKGALDQGEFLLLCVSIANNYTDKAKW